VGLRPSRLSAATEGERETPQDSREAGKTSLCVESEVLEGGLGGLNRSALWLASGSLGASLLDASSPDCGRAGALPFRSFRAAPSSPLLASPESIEARQSSIASGRVLARNLGTPFGAVSSAPLRSCLF
jgi:hypothetical protein